MTTLHKRTLDSFLGPILYIQDPYCTFRTHIVHSGPILYVQDPYCTFRTHIVRSGPILYVQDPYCTFRTHIVRSGPHLAIVQPFFSAIMFSEDETRWNPFTNTWSLFITKLSFCSNHFLLITCYSSRFRSVEAPPLS